MAKKPLYERLDTQCHDLTREAESLLAHKTKGKPIKRGTLRKAASRVSRAAGVAVRVLKSQANDSHRKAKKLDRKAASMKKKATVIKRKMKLKKVKRVTILSCSQTINRTLMGR